MKRLALAIIVALVICTSGCVPSSTARDTDIQSGSQVRGVWFSFSELDAMLSAGDFKVAFKAALENCSELGITDVFVHVRPFCDSIYPSQYFPLRGGYGEAGFDVLEYMVDTCHGAGIKIHAWINPYRVKTSDSEPQTLPAESPAYKWLNDASAENDRNVCFANGIYLDPSSSEVRRLIIDGIREILNNYEIDGIHFDDYFYPVTDAEFDEEAYVEYSAECKKPLGLGDWRRANVNSLISGCFQAIKFISKDIVFSVSPSASIERNYNEHYADVAAWAESGCVDWLIPQLYFGYEYPDEDYRFDRLLKAWKELSEDTSVRLMAGLATYKIGTSSAPDSAEWSEKTDIISRQVADCTLGTSGYGFFSYSSLFSEAEKNRLSLEALKAVL